MTPEDIIRGLRRIKVFGVINWRHDTEVIDEAVEIVKKFAIVANLGGVDNHVHEPEKPGGAGES